MFGWYTYKFKLFLKFLMSDMEWKLWKQIIGISKSTQLRSFIYGKIVAIPCLNNFQE